MKVIQIVLATLIIVFCLPIAFAWDVSIMLLERHTRLRGWKSWIAGGLVAAGSLISLMNLWTYKDSWVAVSVWNLNSSFHTMLQRYISPPTLTFHHENNFLVIIYSILLSLCLLLYYLCLLTFQFLFFCIEHLYGLLLIVFMLVFLSE